MTASALCANAQETAVTVWENAESTVNAVVLTPASGDALANYNKLVGTEEGQAALAGGDKVRISYTGAVAGTVIYVQNKSSQNIAEIGAYAPRISEGDGSIEFYVNDAAREAIVKNGLYVRFNKAATYITRIEVLKYDKDAAGTPAPTETITWQGTLEGASASIDFRYAPVKTYLLDALAPGKKIKVYMSGVEEGNAIYFEVYGTGSNLNKETALEAGATAYELEVTQDDIDLMQEKGMLIKHSSTGLITHYVTVPAETGGDDPTTGLENVAVDDVLGEVRAYNVYGQRVSPTAKGLVIINGKKIYNR